MQVVEGKHEVLVLEDTWRWEFKFLRRVLEEDPSFRFTALLARGERGLPAVRRPGPAFAAGRLPAEPGPADAPSTRSSSATSTRSAGRATWHGSLHQLVAEEGKSLVVLAGPNLAHWLRTPDLLALLARGDHARDGQPGRGAGCPAASRLKGRGSPFFLQPGAGRKTIALPRARPDLSAAAQEAGRDRPAGGGDGLGNAYGPLIVMAEQTVGRGRVLYVGTDTVWKWQTLTTAADANSTPYHLFWQQTLRALAPAAAGRWRREPVAATAPQPLRGRPAGRRPRRGRVAGHAARRRPCAASVSLPDGKSVPLSFAADPAAAGAYLAEFQTPQPGTYQLTATLLSEGKGRRRGRPRPRRGGGPAGEGRRPGGPGQPRPHRRRDGRPLDRRRRPRDLAGQRRRTADAIREQRTVDLWNRGHLLVLLAAVAGLDWLLRLLRGYV